MLKILFICHGNICRSPMAEFVFNHLAAQSGLSSQMHADSAAVSSEELGNDIHRGTRQKLIQMKIPFSPRRARQVVKADYGKYDMLIVMDENNLRRLKRIIGEDAEHKVHKLLDFTERKGEDIADPWYTGDFDETFNDVLEGCKGVIGAVSEK
ncbi:MAG: low molecular weight phosphotyrosine protein phosphatase [Bacteroides sp.]|nr:low molecular weight phosphotyrosine protein phosphatase [Bacteroides sp.]